MKSYITLAVVAALGSISINAIAEAKYWVLKPVPVLRASDGTASPPPGPAGIALDHGLMPEGMLGKAYNFDFRTVTSIQGAGQDWSSVTWSLGGGALPTGLSLSNSGKLTGTPTVKTATAGSDFTVVGSYKTAIGQQVYTIKVGDAFLRVTQVDTGSTHTCAITTAGGAKCWGGNGSGQLGNNSTTQSNVPVDVVGLTAGVASISAGSTATCAVTAAGAAKCWGYNGNGQLGNNSTTQSRVPVDVVGLTSGVAAVSTGGSYSCAVTSTGGAKCWGSNAAGRLGNGSTTDSPVPVDVVGLSSGVVKISATDSHTCALTVSGSALCWGANSSGQLGTNSTVNSTVPVAVVGLNSGVAAISAGSGYSCAMTTSGGAKCWGSNGNGQLGNGSTTRSLVPVDVAGLTSGVASVSAGNSTACAVTTGGAAKCWGLGVFGQLGTGVWMAQSNVPVEVLGLSSGVASIASGLNHVCAAMASGAAKCWGSNGSAQLGNNASTDALEPVDVVD